MEHGSRHRSVGPARQAGSLQPGQPPLVIAGQAEDRIQSGHRHPPVLDDHPPAQADAVDERAQLILGVGYTGAFHNAIIAIL